jgi:phosphatidylglycerol lysyltransferase
MRRSTWRYILAMLVASMGIANMLSSVVVRTEGRQRLLHAFLPLEITHGTRHLAVVAGLVLLAMARGLWRGKRWPWLITLAVLVGSAVLHLLKGLDWEEASAALALAAVLGWQRDAFQARSDPPTVRRAFAALGWGIVILVVYTLLGSYLLRSSFAAPWNIGTVMQEVGARLLLGTGPLQPVTRRAGWFLDSLSVVGVALLAYVVTAFLRSFVAPRAAPNEREQAQALLRRYGISSLSYFALMPDKSLFFGCGVEGVIAYAVASDVAVVCGDPIVAPQNLAQLVHEFMQHCVRHGWHVCLYEVQEQHVPVYAAHGLSTLKIGEDAWIDLRAFTLKGKPIADIRHAISKVERDGLSFKQVGPGDTALWQQMHMIAATHDRGDMELRFSIGCLPAKPDPEACYTAALGSDGTTVLGCCAWLPIYAANGWALDVMLRHAGAPNGTMEYLIAQSLLLFQNDGATWASLGVAPLADAAVEQDDERSLLQRGVRFLYEHPRINELYRYKSLFFFKRKFVPAWRSVYLVYTSRLSLPRILYAVLKVHLPAVGPGLVTDFLREQGERNLERWRDWARRRLERASS